MHPGHVREHMAHAQPSFQAIDQAVMAGQDAMLGGGAAAAAAITYWPGLAACSWLLNPASAPCT